MTAAAPDGVNVHPARYRFGPRDTRELLLGLRPSQLGYLIGAVVVLIVGFATGGAVALVTMPLAAGAVIVAVGRLGGYGADQHLVLRVRAALMRVRGTDRRRVDLATAVAHPRRLDVPLDGTELHALPVEGGGSIGVLHDRAHGTCVAIIAVTGGGLPLADSDMQAQQVSGWGRVLAAIGRDGSPLTRVQWLARTGTTEAAAPASMPHVAESATTLAATSYRDLLATARQREVTHETYLAVACGQRSGRGDDVLVRELARICDLLTAANLDVIGVLPPRAVARLLRRHLDPTSTHNDSDPPDATADCWSVTAMAAETTWEAYRVDGVWHVTYWIAEWPRTDVAPDFLASLLVGADVELTVALTGQPMTTATALRRLRSARASAHADGQLRAKLRQSATVRDDLEASEVDRRDAELAAGHVVYSFAGFLTITATTRDALDDGCVIVEHAAARAGLVLRRLFGQQDRAFTRTLPLARPLR